MLDYLSGIYRCRYFIRSLVWIDLRTRYRRSALGLGWSLLNPIMMTAVMCTVFHKMFNLNIREYAPSLLVGICFWNYVTTVTVQGAQCLFQGECYIRQYPAPMAIYPLRTVLGGTFHFYMALVVTVLLRWGLHGFNNIPALISLVPTLLLLFLMGWAIATIVGFATAYFPDTQQLSEVGLQMLFYATPIIYPPALLRDKGLSWIVDYNPLAAFVDLLREPILHGRLPSALAFGTACLTSLAMAGLAMAVLRRFEKKIIFQL